MHLFRFVMTMFICATFSLPAVAELDQSAPKQVRYIADRVGERANLEFQNSWREFRTLTNSAGRDDGTRLTGYMQSACDVDRQSYWLNVSHWLTEHVSHRRSNRKAANISQSFRVTILTILKKKQKLLDQGEEGAVLLPGESLLSEVESKAQGVRQYAEMLLIIRETVGALAAIHEEKPTSIESSFSFALWRRLQCEFGDQSGAWLLETSEEGAIDAETELAALIVFANIHDLEMKSLIFDATKANDAHTPEFLEQMEASLEETRRARDSQH